MRVFLTLSVALHVGAASLWGFDDAAPTRAKAGGHLTARLSVAPHTASGHRVAAVSEPPFESAQTDASDDLELLGEATDAGGRDSSEAQPAARSVEPSAEREETALKQPAPLVEQVAGPSRQDTEKGPPAPEKPLVQVVAENLDPPPTKPRASKGLPDVTSARESITTAAPAFVPPSSVEPLPPRMGDRVVAQLGMVRDAESASDADHRERVRGAAGVTSTPPPPVLPAKSARRAWPSISPPRPRARPADAQTREPPVRLVSARAAASVQTSEFELTDDSPLATVNAETLSPSDPASDALPVPHPARAPVQGLGASLTASVLELLMPRLEYPRLARRRGWEGTVKVQVALGPSGLVDEARVLESSGHPVLDRAALDGMRGLNLPSVSKRLSTGVLTRVVVPVEYRLTARAQ